MKDDRDVVLAALGPGLADGDVRGVTAAGPSLLQPYGQVRATSGCTRMKRWPGSATGYSGRT